MFLRGWAESIYQKRGSGVAEKEEHRRGDGCNAGYPLISFCTRIWRFLRRSPSWETELGLDEQGALKAFNRAVRGCNTVHKLVQRVQDVTKRSEIEELNLLQARLAGLEAAFD
jgi:hypothetical protein